MEDEQELAFAAMNPEMGAKRAAQIFRRAKDTKQMMSELPSKIVKMNKGHYDCKSKC
jgi:hypothetical protein